MPVESKDNPRWERLNPDIRTLGPVNCLHWQEALSSLTLYDSAPPPVFSPLFTSLHSSIPPPSPFFPSSPPFPSFPSFHPLSFSPSSLLSPLSFPLLLFPLSTLVCLHICLFSFCFLLPPLNFTSDLKKLAFSCIMES